MRSKTAALGSALAPLVAALLCAAAPPRPLPAAWLQGEPTIAPGTDKGVFVWTDDKGVHVRWSFGGQVVLLSGRLKADKDLGAITRVNELAGGWAQLGGKRVALFSATARAELDGFDLAAPAGALVELEVQLDARPADPALVFFGAGQAGAKALPARFAVR